jgi:indolepyruvate ferredoxin oxidoreductase beta subunit
MAQAEQGTRPFSILIAALGGEGGGVLAEWIVAAATAQGCPVQSSSIPGVAQRTGATTYYVEIQPAPAGPAGRRALLTLAPSPGCVDVILASELLEAGRALLNGYVTPDRTTLIASIHRVYTVAEKMQMGDGRYDTERLLAAAAALSKCTVLLDMQEMARSSGTLVNAILFGALAGSGVSPLGREACEQAIRSAGRGTEASLKGFAQGYEHAAETAGAGAPDVARRRSAAAFDRVRREFPAATHEMLELGVARVTDFQDAGYARAYLDRLAPLAQLDGGDCLLTRETARFLALWMSYEDVIRVADLKSRRSRVERVRSEVRAKPHEPVHVVEYFRPRPEEFAAILPPLLGRLVLKIVPRKFNPGLHLKTTSITGMLLLRALAALKPFRRESVRYAEEQALIERWLAAIARAAGSDMGLATEIALCGRLIKGYGDTHQRGRASFLRILEALVEPQAGAARPELAQTVREAREAALADAGGRRLEDALAARGIEPRPPEAKPLTFIRRPTERRAA